MRAGEEVDEMVRRKGDVQQAEVAGQDEARLQVDRLQSTRVREFVLRDQAGKTLARGTLAEIGKAVQERWPNAGVVGIQWTIHDGVAAVGSIRNS